MLATFREYTHQSKGGGFDACSCLHIIFPVFAGKYVDPVLFRFRSIFFLTVLLSETAVITHLDCESPTKAFFRWARNCARDVTQSRINATRANNSLFIVVILCWSFIKKIWRAWNHYLIINLSLSYHYLIINEVLSAWIVVAQLRSVDDDFNMRWFW